MIRPTLCIIALSILIHCKSIPFQPSNHSGDFIAIGEGGGFAGLEERYYVTDDGHVYQKGLQDSSFVLIKRLPLAIIDQTFENCRTFSLIDYTYNNPGNTYFFLSLHFDQSENTIVWSRNDEEVLPLCKNIYQSLNHLIHEN